MLHVVLPGPSERLLRDAYQCGRGWVGGGVGGLGGFRGRNRGMGGGFGGFAAADSGNREWVARETGCGKRESGNRDFRIRGIPECAKFADSELTGVHICARNRGIRRNSPPETPENGLRKPPENPRISK